MTSPSEIAESYAESARRNYEDGQELAPILVLHNERRAVICMMQGSDDMPAAYGRTLALGAAIFKPEYVITVTEVWMKTIERITTEEQARAEMGKVRRGDLAREAEAGSTAVKTALMTTVWTLDPRESVSIIDIVIDDKVYDRTTTIGEQEGWMVECVIGGWNHGRSTPPPPMELPDELAAAVIGMGGDVVAVAFERAE